MPCFGLIESSVRVLRITHISPKGYFTAVSAAGIPPATLVMGLTSSVEVSSGGCAPDFGVRSSFFVLILRKLREKHFFQHYEITTSLRLDPNQGGFCNGAVSST